MGGHLLDVGSARRPLDQRHRGRPAARGRRTRDLVELLGVGLVHGDGATWSVVSQADGFPSRNPTDLAVSSGPRGQPILWVASYDRGLFWRDAGGWHALESARVQSASGVYGLLANPGRRPDVWVGTRGLGLQSVDLSSWRTIDESDGLPSPEVNAFAADPADPASVWIGTARGLATGATARGKRWPCRRR